MTKGVRASLQGTLGRIVLRIKSSSVGGCHPLSFSLSPDLVILTPFPGQAQAMVSSRALAVGLADLSLLYDEILGAT